MSEGMKTTRNVAIIVILAAAVYFIPGGGRAAGTVERVLWVAFGGGMAYLGLRQYREHRFTLNGLGERHRALLYGGLAVAVFAFVARTRMWQTGFGELAWFVLILGVIYALMEVYRHSRSY
jgi:hypothetical protein